MPLKKSEQRSGHGQNPDTGRTDREPQIIRRDPDTGRKKEQEEEKQQNDNSYGRQQSQGE